ncbi:M42 family peptidase [Candidatus Bathyarchaeota archaeon]|nr:MAG: M42 family peptidase [Candidatus Bathyarchaeota archaeon]
MKELRELFLRLVGVGAPSGFEEPVMRVLKSELEPLVDEVHDTPRGNVVGVQRGSDPEAPSVALVAHMDQIGFIVTNIDGRGFIRFRKLGGPVTRAIQGQQMRLLTGRGPVVGVVGIKPGHITRPEEANRVPPIEEMYIDIGARSREEAEKRGITIGTPIVYNAAPVELANDLIASPAVDDRAGLTALIAVAKTLREAPVPATVYYVGSVEEEIGLRGAEVALYDLDVDMAVAVDTFPAGWQPDVVMRDLYYEVGRGPAVHIGEIAQGRVRLGHQRVRQWLMEAADEEGIPYQAGLMHGGTDAMSLMQTRAGIPACTLGIPRLYSHSPVETFDLKDLHRLVRILVAAIRRLDAGFSLRRI